jgi:ABC-type dipeptide/oligopeptide/nickel transport system permease component
MLNYIIRRLLLMIPTLLGITLLVFLTMALSPGGLMGPLADSQGEARPDERKYIEEYYRRRYGLDRPVLVQYLTWLNHVSPVGFEVQDDGSLGRFRLLKMPDLGRSRSNEAVTQLVARALPITLLLNLIALPIVYGVSVTAGIYAARHRGKLFDHASGVAFMALWSLPQILVGVLLIGFLANRDILRLFPESGLHDIRAGSFAFLPHWSGSTLQRGWLLDFFWHLVAPVICLTYAGFAFLSKLMRASVLDNLASDFVRTARAKGVDERRVLFAHVLRNSLLPLITVAASILPAMLGGSLIVETIFSINGMGRMMIAAIMEKDREIVLANTLVVGFISLLSLLVADILYAVADPRVSYE